MDLTDSTMPGVTNDHETLDAILWVRPRIVQEQIGSVTNWGQDDDTHAIPMFF